METIGISKLDLKRQNRMQILRLLRNHGPISRIDIAATIHITKAAVTIITNEMIEEGILQEVGEQAPTGGKVSRGRKKILVGINPTWRLILGISLQGGWLDIGLCTLCGGIVEHHAVALEENVDTHALLQMIALSYNDLVYKNALKADNLLGLGVSVDAPFYDLCGISEQNGILETANFAHALRQIVHVPVIVNRITEGIAAAETSFRMDAVEAASNQIVLQMGGSFGSSVTIRQETYRGMTGTACNIGGMPLGEEGISASQRLSRHAVSQQLQTMRAQRLCPILDSVSMDNPQRAEWMFCRTGFVPEDAAVRQYFDCIRDDYTTILSFVLHFYDPEQIILFPDGSVMEALSQAMRSVNNRFSGNEAGPVRLTRFDETNLFLTGAALAEDLFFIQRGGYQESVHCKIS